MEIRVKTLKFNYNKQIDGHDTVYNIEYILNNVYNSIFYKYKDNESILLKIPFLYTGIDCHLIDKFLYDFLHTKMNIDNILNIDTSLNRIYSDASGLGIKVNNELLDSWFSQDLLHEIDDKHLKILDMYSNSMLKSNKINRDCNIVKYSKVTARGEFSYLLNEFINDILNLQCIVNIIETSGDNDDKFVTCVIPYVEVDDDIYLVKQNNDYKQELYDKYFIKAKVDSALITEDVIDLYIMSENIVKIDGELLESFDTFYTP